MQNIQSIILASIQSLYGLELETSAIEISPAPKPELGEYCINVFPLTRLINESPLSEGEGLGVRWKSPNIIATEVAQELMKHAETFRSTSATGGYVNFFLTDTVWMKLFQGIVIASESEAIQNTKEQDFSLRSASLEMTETKNQEPRTKNQPTIIVDYIGANAGKPLHIAHICTPSIGQVICNVYRHLGYRVIGDSHFGDWWGIFGKLIFQWKNEDLFHMWKLASFNKDIPKEERSNYWIYTAKLETLDLLDNKIRSNVLNDWLEKYGIVFLYNLYLRFHMFHEWRDSEEDIRNREEWSRAEFKKLSEWDIQNIELWKKFTSISIAETEKKLDLLNVHATYNIGESFYEGLGLRPNDEDYPDLEYTMKDIVKELIKKWIATENEDGSVGVIFPEESKLPSCVLQKKDGTGLYLTSDLAAIKYRLTNGWNPEKIIYSVDVRQQLHLRQAFWIAQKAWWEELGAKDVEFTHAFNGFIKLKEGAMSTRHGTVIFLEALIDEGNERTEKILEEKWRVGEKALGKEDIQAITIAAIKYSYLAQDREKDVTFDWDKALNFEGNSWPYIQYAYVRAKKIGTSVIASESEAIQETKNDSSFWVDRFPESSSGQARPRDDGATMKFELSSYDKSLIQILTRFDEIVDTVAKTYKPHHLALYAYDVAGVFNSFYVHTPKILEETDAALRQFRLALVSATVRTLSTSFDLLGIQMPSEM